MGLISALLAAINWPAIICIIIGIILVVIEMHIPSFGVPGIIGVILLAAGVILFSKSVLEALILVIIILIILGVAIVLVYKSAAKGKIGKHLVLKGSLEKGDTESLLSEETTGIKVGSEGKAFTVLRPAGSAIFNGVKADVISNGDFIQKDAQIIVEKIEGNKIIVRQKTEE